MKIGLPLRVTSHKLANACSNVVDIMKGYDAIYTYRWASARANNWLRFRWATTGAYSCVWCVCVFLCVGISHSAHNYMCIWCTNFVASNAIHGKAINSVMCCLFLYKIKINISTACKLRMMYFVSRGLMLVCFIHLQFFGFIFDLFFGLLPLRLMSIKSIQFPNTKHSETCVVSTFTKMLFCHVLFFCVGSHFIAWAFFSLPSSSYFSSNCLSKRTGLEGV